MTASNYLLSTNINHSTVEPCLLNYILNHFFTALNNNFYNEDSTFGNPSWGKQDWTENKNVVPRLTQQMEGINDTVASIIIIHCMGNRYNWIESNQWLTDWEQQTLTDSKHNLTSFLSNYLQMSIYIMYLQVTTFPSLTTSIIRSLCQDSVTWWFLFLFCFFSRYSSSEKRITVRLVRDSAFYFHLFLYFFFGPVLEILP